MTLGDKLYTEDIMDAGDKLDIHGDKLNLGDTLDIVAKLDWHGRSVGPCK